SFSRRHYAGTGQPSSPLDTVSRCPPDLAGATEQPDKHSSNNKSRATRRTRAALDLPDLQSELLSYLLATACASLTFIWNGWLFTIPSTIAEKRSLFLLASRTIERIIGMSS